jgi:class 3 adenylate cyclase
VLWHGYIAQVIQGLVRGGVRGIALDIIPTVSLERLAPNPKLVPKLELGNEFKLELGNEFIRSMKLAKDQDIPIYLGFSAGEKGQMPHRKYLFFSGGTGFLNLYPDEDEKIRTQILFLKDKQGQTAYSLPMLLTKPVTGFSPENAAPKLYIDYRIQRPSVFSFHQVYDWAANGIEENLKRSFNGKWVLIGVTAPILQDTHPVPFKSKTSRYYSGVFIHLQTAMTLLSGQLFREVPGWVNWGLAAGLGLISGILFLFLSPNKAGGIIAVLFICTAAGIFKAFAAFWVIRAAPLIYFLFIPGMIIGMYHYVSEHHQFRRLQRFFKSYVNAKVMREILEHPENISFEGQHVEATVMFTDIRNFTTLSEHMNPQDVVAGLNLYFTEMTRTVVAVDGYLNRYLGDGILAVFGAPNKLPDNGAMAAVRCGLKMLEQVEKLNRSELFPGIEQIKIGIGIHTGEVIVGNVGCYEKMDYTVIGDTVNLASRIESKTKEYQTPLLISETTYERVRDRISARFVASAAVKGRAQEVKLYAPNSFPSSGLGTNSGLGTSSIKEEEE